jgi:hypothetical protein
MIERPIMPGETSEERVIAFNPLPETVALEALVDALRDEVVDLVALRARLEARMKARLEGNDWDGVEAALKEFERLAPRDQFAKRLAEIKEGAVRQQGKGERPVLTRTAQAQINDLQALIDRYLDDDAVKAYGDALASRKADTVAKEKARADALTKRPVLPPPGPGRAKSAQPVASKRPQPAAPPKPQPKPAQPASPTVPF